MPSLDQNDISLLRSAIGQAANLLRTYTIGYLTVALYITVTAAGTTHEQLLIGKEVTLPVVNFGVPLIGFYVLAPVFLLLAHGNLLFHLQTLARRLQWFGESISELRQAEQERERRLLEPFQVVEWRTGADKTRISRVLNDLVVWLVYFTSGPAVLLFVQFSFAPFQHLLVTPFHFFLVMIDVVITWYVWRTLNSSTGSATTSAQARPWDVWLVRRGLAYFPFLAVPIALFFWSDIYKGKWLSAIEARGSILMTQVPFAERLVAHQEDLVRNNSINVEEAEDEALRVLAQPISLAGRRLRRANLAGAKIIGANLRKAQLQGANLDGARLQDADFSAAQLQEASLNEARLQGTSLRGTELQGASMYDARLQGASVLDRAQLQRADLRRARLQGANLGGARLQGADLTGAQLQGADLGGAQLQGADLTEAELQGARLEGAQLQGASLRKSSLWGIRVNETTDFSLADLSQATARKPEQNKIDELRGMAEAIGHHRIRLRVREALEPLIKQPPTPWRPQPLPGAPRNQEIFLDGKTDKAIWTLVGLKQGMPTINSSAYRSRLAAFARSSNDWIACGIAKRLYDDPSLPSTGPSSAQMLLDSACLTAQARDDLTDAAERACKHRIEDEGLSLLHLIRSQRVGVDNVEVTLCTKDHDDDYALVCTYDGSDGKVEHTRHADYLQGETLLGGGDFSKRLSSQRKTCARRNEITPILSSLGMLRPIAFRLLFP